MTDENSNQIDGRDAGGDIGRRSGSARRAMNATN